MKKYYAVKIGRSGSKIYDSWESCFAQVSGFPGAIYKSFGSLAEAQRFIGEKTSVSGDLIPETKEIPNGPMVCYNVYTDGSCLNQGTSQAIAGSGVWSPELHLSISSRVPGAQTNNRGELWAVIIALQTINLCHLSQPFIINICTDSEYVMNNINSNNKVNLDLWEKLWSLLSNTPVQWTKILAHSGNPGNEMADSLAKKGAEK